MNNPTEVLHRIRSFRALAAHVLRRLEQLGKACERGHRRPAANS